MNPIELSDYLRERGLPIPLAALGKPELHDAVRLAADHGEAWSRISAWRRQHYVLAAMDDPSMCPTCRSELRGVPGVGWVASGCSDGWHFALEAS